MTRSICFAVTVPASRSRMSTAAGPSGTPVLPQRRAETGWMRQREANLANVMSSLSRMRRNSVFDIAMSVIEGPAIGMRGRPRETVRSLVSHHDVFGISGRFNQSARCNHNPTIRGVMAHRTCKRRPRQITDALNVFRGLGALDNEFAKIRAVEFDGRQNSDDARRALEIGRDSKLGRFGSSGGRKRKQRSDSGGGSHDFLGLLC